MKTSSCNLLLCACIFVQFFAATGAAAGNAEISERSLEEVVVTARKREELLRNAPLSVSVMNGDVLDTVEI